MRALKQTQETERALAQSAPGSLTIPTGLSAASLWAAVTTEPNTGIWITSLDGRVVGMNDQAAKILHGPDAKGADYAGRKLSDLHSPAWVAEHLAVLRRVLLLGKPVVVRTICRGWQQVSWISSIESEPQDHTLPLKVWAGPPAPRFLVTTRRQESDAPAEAPAEKARHEVIDSESIDLGPMTVLTRRELEVLALIGQGLSNREIAQTLFRSVKTVDNHRTAIMAKLSVRSRLKLAMIARRAGLTLKDAGRARL